MRVVDNELRFTTAGIPAGGKMKKGFAFRFFEEDDFYDEDQINSTIIEFEKKFGVKEEKELRRERERLTELNGIIFRNVVVICTFS